MDAELLKSKHTHDVMSYYVPQCRRLLYFVSYINQTYPEDAGVKDLKERLAEALEPSINKPIPINIASYALRTLHEALYYQCIVSDPIKEKNNLLDEYIRLSDSWKRVILGLDDAENQY